MITASDEQPAAETPETETPLPPLFARRDGFDPIPELGRLRRQRPVTRMTHHWGVPVWVLTSHADVRAVLADYQHFLSVMPPYCAGSAGDGGETDAEGGDGPSVPGAGMFVSYDPPEHTRIRRMLTPEFTARRLARLESWIKSSVDEHLDAMERSGAPADLVEAFAMPLPFLVICELFGVPDSDRGGLIPLSKQWTNISLPVEDRLAASDQMVAYMLDFIKSQRVSPGDGVVGTLTRDHGGELSNREIAGISQLMLIAGYETTASTLSLGTLLLLRDPRHVRLLFEGDKQLDHVCEELLRYLSVAHNTFPRVAKEDVTIGGQRIKAGDLLICALPIANRDEALGEDMDSFDPTREISQHVVFGHGIHYCIGAPLARLEVRIALPALFQRFPGLRLAVPFEEIRWSANTNFYGLQSLPVAW